MAGSPRNFLLLLIFLVGLWGGHPAQADSWLPPRVKTYHSANRSARLIVTPHFPPRERAPYSRRPRGPSAPDQARGILQRRDQRGRWVLLWEGPLVNEVAPVDAVVADSGRYFVTFDDWGWLGLGTNVVVIYDGAGRTIRALSLLDLVPRDYADTLPRTFSSIWWSEGGHRISDDGEQLLLRVGIPSADQALFPGDHFEQAVMLATGEPVRGGAEWERAMAAAAAARVAESERREAFVAFMTEPLVLPQASDPEAWNAYLREAFKRLAPDWEMNNPRNMLVRQAGAPPYEGAFSPDPATIFRQRALPRAIAIASPEGVPLAPALAPLVARRRAGWLRGIRLYIVADDAAWGGLVELFRTSGATLIQLDPATPIAQRPDRLPRN